MTKIKKISKIIPAVLLSGAMVVPVSQLTSPVIANAYENSAYTQKAVDYTPTITKLVDAELNSPQSRSVQRTNNNNVVVPTNGEIKVNLEGKDYHEFNAKLVVPKEHNSSIRYRVYLDDDRQIRDISINPGQQENLHVELFNDDAKELKIVATSSSNSRANNSGVIENGNFTTYYTDYTEKMNTKNRTERSPYIRASFDSLYIGTHHIGAQHLTTNREVVFKTVSSDPVLTKIANVSNTLYTTDGPTVTSEKGIRKQVYNGQNQSCTIGANVAYDVEEGFRARQYYDGNGKMIRSHLIPYKTCTPVKNTVMYASVRTNSVQW